MNMDKERMDEQSRLVPILREGVNLVRMLIFKALRDDFTQRYGDRGPGYALKLAGAVLNELFGTANPEESFVRFVRANETAIRDELGQLADRHENLRIPLTDALRVQFLCDSHEGGGGDEAVLTRARDLGVLITDRDVPLPKNFLNLVRRLGSSAGFLVPPVIHEESGEA